MSEIVNHNIRTLSNYPADTLRKNDVILTSMRRDDVASTMIRRHYGTKCPIGNKGRREGAGSILRDFM